MLKCLVAILALMCVLCPVSFPERHGEIVSTVEVTGSRTIYSAPHAVWSDLIENTK